MGLAGDLALHLMHRTVVGWSFQGNELLAICLDVAPEYVALLMHVNLRNDKAEIAVDECDHDL